MPEIISLYFNHHLNTDEIYVFISIPFSAKLTLEHSPVTQYLLAMPCTWVPLLVLPVCAQGIRLSWSHK